MKYLHTKLGDFYVEADGQILPVKILDGEDKFSDDSSKYKVDFRKIIIPDLSAVENFHELRLKCNFLLAECQEVDVISDEFFCGWEWRKHDFVFGAAAFVDNNQLDEFACYSSEELPYYIEFKQEYMASYRFSIAIKQFESVDDLSIFMACDFYGSEMPR